MKEDRKICTPQQLEELLLQQRAKRAAGDPELDALLRSVSDSIGLAVPK